MNAHRLLVFLAATLLVAVGAAKPAAGQIIGIEPIGDPLAPLIVVPGQPINMFFPNIADPTHPKKMTFEGTLINDDPLNHDAEFHLWFDWDDAATGGISTSPPFIYTLPAGVPEKLGGATAPMWTIPYCPPRVSIHFEIVGPDGVVAVNGLFTHECIIPEPGSLALAFAACAGLAAFVRPRRR
ncbi:MAG: hypothetical protein KDA44_17965 [Planctomycetales bacterium]|nr:hypothetical protein [Planctomycetales bacterium]